MFDEMNALTIAAWLATVTAIGHSVLSERLILRPMREESIPGTVFAAGYRRRLASAMFHLPSVFWSAMGLSMLLINPANPGSESTLVIYAVLFALSGIGNFWSLRRPHPGGILLFSAAGLIAFTLMG